MTDTIFFRLLDGVNRPSRLSDVIKELREGGETTDTYVAEPASLRQVPGSPFAYWAPESARSVFTKMKPFETDNRMVRQGGVTGDDARYLRAYWEVPPHKLHADDIAWVPFAKGGNLSPYWRDLSVVVHWDFSRGTFYGYTGLLHRPSEKPSSADLYFRSGLTWPLRASRYAPIPLPEGCVFSIRGYAILAPRSELPALLALGNSAVFDSLFKMALGRSGFPEFVVGVLQNLPMPDISKESKERLSELAIQAIALARSFDQVDETTHSFYVPALVTYRNHNLALTDVEVVANDRVAETDRRLSNIQVEIDEFAWNLYGFDEHDRKGLLVSINASSEEDFADKEAVDDVEPK